MSIRSTTSRKRRAVTQSRDGALTDAIKLQYPAASLASISRVSEQNGNERQSASSILTKPRYPYYLTLRDLTSLIAPPFKAKITSYGYNTALYTGPSAAAPEGNLRTLYSPSGKQYWFESIGLPAIDPTANPTILSVDQLIKKAPDVRNVANVTPNTTGLGPLIVPNDSALDQQFQYLSGYQRHQFVNSGNTTVHCEFWEAHPRRPMPGYLYLGAGPHTALTIGQDVLADFRANVPLQNTQAPVNTPSSTDELTDLSVRINSDSATTHYKYKITKPMRVTIQPGGTFVYTLRFEPFKFTNTEWNVLLAPNYVDVMANPFNQSHFIPGFTKILVGRMWGELSHSEQVDHLHPHVGAGPISLNHIMTEYHHCRALPYQPTRNVVTDYRLDTNNDIVFHEDELEQDTEAFAN